MREPPRLHVRKDFIGGGVMYTWENTCKKYVVKDRLRVYNMNPDIVIDFMDSYGRRLLEHLGYDEPADRYI